MIGLGRLRQNDAGLVPPRRSKLWPNITSFGLLYVEHLGWATISAPTFQHTLLALPAPSHHDADSLRQY